MSRRRPPPSPFHASRFALPVSPRTIFVYAGTGFPKMPRCPWPVLSVLARAAVSRSYTKRCTTPPCTRHVTRDGTHSSSSGRDAVRPEARGSSVRDKPAWKTCSPTRFPSGEMPCTTALPDSPRGVGDAGFGHLALDGDVDLAPLARQALEQPLTDLDQPLERRVGGASDVGCQPGELGRGWKDQRDFFPELGRGERALQEGCGMLRRCIPDADICRARDTHAAAVQHAQIHPALLGHARRFEAAPLERDRAALHATLERVRASSPLHPMSRQLQQPVDHAGMSPPIRASSMRTCGAPSVTGRGYCPALPQPPPIWFQRKSPAM